MKTELTVFRVKPGKEGRANEWMDLLVERRQECIATLRREAMYVETIFRLESEGGTRLAWFSIQGDVHGDVDGSEHEIDRLHCAFFDECLERDPRPLDFAHVLTLLPPEVERTIAALDRRWQPAPPVGAASDRSGRPNAVGEGRVRRRARRRR